MKLSSDDLRVECWLGRYGHERVAKTLSDPVLSRIAEEVSDEQFLEAASIDGSARNRTSLRLVVVGVEFE